MALLFALLFLFLESQGQNPPTMVMFHWHMHQPIYYPYESVVTTIEENRFDNLLETFDSRAGDYTQWPMDAITSAAKAGLGHCGAQVSFSGALQENLNNLGPSNLTTNFRTWNNSWVQAQTNLRTQLSNPAIYLTAFGYHHPLMTLAADNSPSNFVSLQIQLHRLALSKFMGVPQSTYPRGLFPPENSFSPRMIPSLLDAGIEWVIVDNIHFDRAHIAYPFTFGSNLYPPNPADQRNNQTTSWVSLQDIWAPGQVSAPFGYRPYWVEYTDPNTGNVSRIIAFPGARYEGVEDGRGGFGAFQYQTVMDQYAFANTDPTRPMAVLLAHDGDNYGGGTDSYYHSNFDNFVSWISGQQDSTIPSRYQCSTVLDYLQRYPVPDSEVIWVEDGSWSGANNGDPQFLKWNPNFFAPGYEPERNSWAVLTAGLNAVATAQAQNPYKSLDNILYGEAAPSASATELAFHWMLCSQASDYEYWPGEQIWDSNPTRAVNVAYAYALKAFDPTADKTPPTVLLPQRQYWNPGAIDWNQAVTNPADFGVWTMIYDVTGITNATLYVRGTVGVMAPTSSNMLYSGGTWQTIPMKAISLTGALAPTTDPLPDYISDLYQANITGWRNALIDYYVLAIDAKGNVARTPLQHVYVASGPSESGH